MTRYPFKAKIPFLAIFLIAAGATTAPSAALDVWNYWLMPHGLVATFDHLTWNDTIIRGEHAFWRGSLWGRTVALQGGSDFTRYDVFVENGSVLEYWGTFRGNKVDDADSHSFDAPFRWMNSSMVVGQAVEHSLPVRLLDSKLHKETSSGTVTMRLEINALYPTWTIPETGVTYSDVLKVTYYSDKSNPNSREVYHLARGKGTIHFDSLNTQEPSFAIRRAWAVSFTNKSVQTPTVPWFDPFFTASGKKTAVLNGFFEDRTSSVNGAPINTALRSWSSLSGDGVITTDAPQVSNAGLWKICLRGSAGGGDGLADAASSDWIPVVGGRTYKLSGWVWRVSTSDNVYLDFNDGIAQGANFTDVQALATTTNTWQYREATVTLPAATTQIKVRAVRDGSNQGNAYFDWIMLQRLN